MYTKTKILVVDDSKLETTVLTSLLQSDEFEITVAHDGQSALETLTTDLFDVLLLDVVMPSPNGLEVLEILRRNPSNQDLPIYILTSLRDPAVRLKAFELGADGILEKPFNHPEVRAIVRNLARLNRAKRFAAQSQELADALMQMQAAYEETILGWVRALDIRDNETEGHSQRVASMTLAMAKRFGIEGEELTHVWRGALLHDLGKIGVPDGILHKNGSLTEDERAIMQKHPQYAYDMLKSISFLKPALEIPYAHHERWDGLGYPNGIAGEEIPFSARIFSVVDVFDALVSTRPYKIGWPESKALAQIQSESGTSFDPRVVEEFLAYRAQLSIAA
jgi:putative two-component system response regulator